MTETTDFKQDEFEDETQIPSATPLDVRADGHYAIRNKTRGEKYYRGRVMIGFPAKPRALKAHHKTATAARSYAEQVVDRYYRLFYAGF